MFVDDVDKLCDILQTLSDGQWLAINIADFLFPIIIRTFHIHIRRQNLLQKFNE